MTIKVLKLRTVEDTSGYVAFSVCSTHVKGKAQYVRDQEIIHANRRFEEEYYEMLAEHPPLDLDDGPSVAYWEPLVDRV